jgi:hypothetical protein
VLVLTTHPHGVRQKFTKWSDKASGVNPFTPPQPRKASKGVSRALGLLGGTLLALVRLPFILATLLCLVVSSVALAPPVLLVAGAGGS